MKGREILDRVRTLIKQIDYSSYVEINEANYQILNRTGYSFSRTRDTDSVTFKDGVTDYILPQSRIRRLEGVYIKDNDDYQEWSPLYEISDKAFDLEVLNNRDSDGDDSTAAPRKYRLSHGAFEVVPTPDGTYECRLNFIEVPELIDDEVTPLLSASYHPTIAKLAAANYLALEGDDVSTKRASALLSMVQTDLLHLFLDTTTNRKGGVSFKKQPIMRS